MKGDGSFPEHLRVPAALWLLGVATMLTGAWAGWW